MIKLIKSTFYRERETKERLVKFIKKARQLSFGQECRKFEENFGKYQQRNECIFLNSGSSANLAIVQALLNLGKIKKGEKVGFSAVTWSTNVMPLIQLGLEPISIDIDLDTLNVSGKRLSECLKKHPIKIFFLTNLLGFCSDIDKIARICKEKKIILIEDNCESLGTVYKRKKLGNFGLASTNSFFVGHHLSTIEGGMVCTDDKDLAAMLRMVRAHGWDRNLDEKEQIKIRKKFKVESSFHDRYTFYDLGYNLRPTEIQGFLGNCQIGYADEINKKRNQNFLKMAGIVYKKTDRYFPIRFDHIDFISNFAFPLICRSQKTKEELIKKCEGRVEIRPIVGGDMNSQPFFRKYVKESAKLPNASIIHNRGMYFSNDPELLSKEINQLIDIFAN